MYKDELVNQLEEVALGIRKARTRVFESKGLHAGQVRVLSALTEYGDLSQADIGRLLDVSGPTVKKLVENLEKERMVSLSISGKDKRVTIVSLTPLGRKQEPSVLRCKKEIGAIASAGMSEPEIIMTGLLLARISENLKNSADDQRKTPTPDR